MVQRKSVTPSVVELSFELPEPVSYEPGQFARFDIDANTWRDYTMIDVRPDRLRFLVDARFNGPGSDFALNTPLDARIPVTVPKGDFVLQRNDRDKVFIATGTGLSPFIAMAREALSCDTNLLVDVIFGCRTKEDDLASLYLADQANDRMQVDVCLSDEQAGGKYWHGYVTGLLAEHGYPVGKTEFYVCGNRRMVDDVLAILRQRRAPHVFCEPY